MADPPPGGMDPWERILSGGRTFSRLQRETIRFEIVRHPSTRFSLRRLRGHRWLAGAGGESTSGTGDARVRSETSAHALRWRLPALRLARTSTTWISSSGVAMLTRSSTKVRSRTA